MAFAGYITVAFIAARLAAPSVGVTNASASLNGIGTLNAQPAVQRSASLTGIATLNAQPAIQRSASLTGIANLTSVASVVSPGSASITGIANLTAL